MWTSGVAPIKSEFLRSIQPKKIEVESKKSVAADVESKSKNEESQEEDLDQEDNVDEEPNDDKDNDKVLTKEEITNNRKRKNEEKKNRRGQNKKRPRPQRPANDERLCASIMDGRPCTYGDQCRFSHDLAKFWSTKLPDISTDRCPNYETFGKCFYGFSCRFASSHVDTKEWKNLENTEKSESLSKEKLMFKEERNRLEKETQNRLRRRQYDFQRSDQILDESNSNRGQQKIVKPELVPDSGLKLENEIGTVETIFGKEKRTPPKLSSWANKLYLAPLTTVGNLPFRRVCTEFGAEITCGEMAMAAELLQGKASEWALVKRHASEKIFGVQMCGSHADVMTKCTQLLTEQIDIDFIDINLGCPIELVCDRGAGCSLMTRQGKLEQIIRSMGRVMPDNVALTVKMRTGFYENKSTAHLLAPKLADMGISLYTIHGRSREQRYTKFPDWPYICQCAKAASPLPCFGCGDVLSYEDYHQHLDELTEAMRTDRGESGTCGIMLARGALIKPWIFTELKEKRHWDISSSERLDILKKYVDYGLQHWGSDQQGVNNTRRFLLEWLSFLHRYIPVGILERVPQKINERPPAFVGRDDLETLMASSNCGDWVKISEMLLGPVQADFSFLPKHKANSYQ